MDLFSPRGDANERHRHLYKMTTPPWKETYRKRCLSRIRQSRDRLVDSFRRFPGSCGADIDGNPIPEIMDQELDSLRKEEVYDGNESFEELEALRKEIYREILEEVSQYEASMGYEGSGSGDPATARVPDIVLCPLCQKAMLRQSGNVIHCDCGLNIDTEQDCLTLSHLSHQLKAGLDTHNASCSANAQFSQINSVGISNLLITCSRCDFMYIVI